MDWHGVLGVVSGLVQISITLPYIRSILRGATRPNTVSWSLWTLTLLITGAAQITSGASWPVVLLIASLLCTVIVLGLCIAGYGYKKFGAVEKASLIFALSAIMLWWFTANPITAIVLAILADAIAYVPTYVKTYREPLSEPSFYWASLVVADILALSSSTLYDAANLLFPVSFAVLNGVVLLMAYLGRRKMRAV